MNLITPLSLFIFTFKLGLTIPVHDDKLNPLVDDEYPMVIRNDRISGHSGRMMMMVKRGKNSDHSLDDETQLTTTTSVEAAAVTTTATILDQDENQSSPSIVVAIDGFKLGQSQIVDDEPIGDVFIDVDKPIEYHHSPEPSTDQIDHQVNKLSSSNATNQLTKDLPEIFVTTTTTTTTPAPTPTSTLVTTTVQSFQDRVNSLIEDSFAQTTKLLIDLEEQIKLGQFNQQIETDYPPLNIFTSTSSQSILPPSPLPLAYGFKLTAHNFLFRPLIRGSSIVSSAINFNHNTNDDLQSLTDSDDIKLDSVNYETLDENANPDNPNSIINHHSHHWYGNQKQSGIQMQSMIDEVTRIEQNVEVLITELVSNRRYVTAAVFRSLLNYLRRLRISLERLQSRMAIIGVGSSPQGSSSVGGSISSSVSSIASSVSSTFLTEQSSGPLGGSSGGISFNPIASGSAIASSYIESIRVRMNRVTEEIRTLINRMRLSFTSSASSSPTIVSNSSSPSSSSSSDPLPPPESAAASLSPTPSSTTTTRSPSSTTRKIPNYYFQ